ncbi:MAG: hypothetical protein ABSD29_02730 [Verrucomicrobiota bacterium]|jgi:hypothetical protein
MRFTTVVRIGAKSHLVKNHLASFVGVVVAFPLMFLSGSWAGLGAESGPPPPGTSPLEETNSQGLLHAYLQLQEQLQATQLAIEQNRQETKAAAAQNAEALAKGLQSIQEAFSVQRAQDLEAMQRSNKATLIVAGTFAAMGFLSMLMMSYFQWRMSKGLAEIAAALPTALGLGAGSAAAALALANQPELRLFGAIEQPEKHTRELEQSSLPALNRRDGTNMSIGNRLFHEPGALVRRRRFRAVTVAVMVGLICAAGLALLLYVVAYRKLGFG